MAWTDRKATGTCETRYGSVGESMFTTARFFGSSRYCYTLETAPLESTRARTVSLRTPDCPLTYRIVIISDIFNPINDTDQEAITSHHPATRDIKRANNRSQKPPHSYNIRYFFPPNSDIFNYINDTDQEAITS